MGSNAYFSGADLSTVDPNPEIYSYGDQSTADQVSQIGNTMGQWGATIASVVTGNAVSTVQTPTGIQTIGARGSTIQTPILQSGMSPLLLVGVLVLVVVLIMRD